MKPTQTPVYQFGIVALQIVGFIAAFFVLGFGELPILDGRGEPIALTAIGLASIGLWSHLAYRIWEKVPESSFHLSPREAAIGLVIPILNLYWFFRVFVGFARACRETTLADAHQDLEPNAIGVWPARIAVIFVLIPIPVVQWISSWVLIGRVGRAANILREPRDEHLSYSRVACSFAIGTAVSLLGATGWIVATNQMAPTFPDVDDPCECDVLISDVGMFGANSPGFYQETDPEAATEVAREIRRIYRDEMSPIINPLPLLQLEVPPALWTPDISEQTLRIEIGPPRRLGSRPTNIAFMALDDYIVFFSEAPGGPVVLDSDRTFDELLEAIDADDLDEDDVVDRTRRLP